MYKALAIIVLLGLSTNYLQAQGKMAAGPQAAKYIDAWYDNLTAESRPGIAILVAKDGKVVYRKGFGYADLAQHRLITPTTKFRIGSITKQFTAAALLKLQEQGRLKISDKVARYIPDFPRGNEVTIHHLLTHTSGIRSYTDTDGFRNRGSKPVTEEGLVRYIKSLPYDFNPGEKYEYNNSGYAIAGYIVHLVSGESYSDFLKKHFFDPLGMKNTGVHRSDLKLEEEALGYSKTNKYERARNWDMSWAGGAGALYSTVDDLLKWNEAVFNKKVLKDESLKAALTPVVLANGSTPANIDYGYGYGWEIYNYMGKRILSHRGGLDGFASHLARFDDDKLTIVMLTNVTPTEVEMNPAKIAELYISDAAKQ